LLFNSQVFLLGFLPLVLAAFFLLARRPVAREWMLILASAVFYGWWDARFLPLLLGQTLLTWLLARALGPRSRWLLPLGVGVNLGVLAMFKYADFAVAGAEALLGVALPRAGLILPIGISFYTFQLVSYLLDLRSGRAPLYGLRRFTLYVTFFPQLVAGPIVRHHELIPQFDLDPLRAGLAERIGRGAALFALGLAKKVFLADALAPTADAAFAAAAGGAPALGVAWGGVIAFGLQIFFDFCAYSEMAMGLALIMGFALPLNFDRPYAARNLQDFWRRWHMTLSRFLRDYLYVPLGGSRHGPLRTGLAILATMGLCGLWHGAGWTYVLWGLLHGAGLLAVRAWGALARPMPFALAWGLTNLLVLAGWPLFRAPDFATAGHMFAGLVGLGGLGLAGGWALIGLAAAVSVLPQAQARWVLEAMPPRPLLGAAVATALLAMLVAVGERPPAAFIYFQF
jgi:D-alanyl-lipoteichoic acid acyltransferase DltB (MBOAT superfamily)